MKILIASLLLLFLFAWFVYTGSLTGLIWPDLIPDLLIVVACMFLAFFSNVFDRLKIKPLFVSLFYWVYDQKKKIIIGIIFVFALSSFLSGQLIQGVIAAVIAGLALFGSKLNQILKGKG